MGFGFICCCCCIWMQDSYAFFINLTLWLYVTLKFIFYVVRSFVSHGFNPINSMPFLTPNPSIHYLNLQRGPNNVHTHVLQNKQKLLLCYFS